MHLFIFGAGYSGQAIARRLGADAARIAGTTRTADKTGDLAAAGIAPHVFDGELSPAIAAELSQTTHLLLSISPDGGGDPVLPRLRADLRRLMPALGWIGYLSTVGVYGDHGGAWVDEETPCRPVSKRSVARLQAETAWRDVGASAGVPTAIIRLSGIYGPGRNAFINLRSGTAKRLIKPGQVFNRIHVADIAGATALLARAGRDGIWNVTDDEPAPPQDVVTYAAKLMGVEPPPAIAFSGAELTPMARSFYGENKRVSNARLKSAGYRFQYPDYRTALSNMWEDREWMIGAAPSFQR